MRLIDLINKMLVNFSEFVDLHNDMKMEFVDYNFPKLPGKWPFGLNDQKYVRQTLKLQVHKL